MSLLKNMRVTAVLGSALFLSVSCTSASFPEIEDESSEMVSEQGERVLKEGNGLLSDGKNIAYHDENIVETVVPAKTTPIIVADAGDLNKEESVFDGEDVDFFGVPFDQEADAPVKKTSKKQQKTAAKSSVSKPASSSKAAPVVPSVTYLAETFYFDNGGSALAAGSNAKIRQIVREAKRNNAFVRVMGFASSRTRNTDMASHKMANFKVSQERAEAVAAALRRAGMPASKILVEAMSDNRPAYLEVMPEGERLNRRAEVYISY
ncbi:MAG: OmpA family protein [Alphaproteobacteria bacterium]|nr:OmpA family protein [Alphaproteobacteria bacterium]